MAGTESSNRRKNKINENRRNSKPIVFPQSYYTINQTTTTTTTLELNYHRRNSIMSFSSQPSEGVTALMLACLQNSVSDVQTILKKNNESYKNKTRSGKVPLHFCAEGGSLRCLELVLAADPTLINTRDEEGYTPLHLAVINGNKEIVKALIAANADVKCVDNEKHSLVHWATVCGELEILDILLNSEVPAATPDIHMAHPIHYSSQMCGNGHGRTIDSRARVQSTVYGISPKKGLTILRRLIQAGVPVDVKDKDGRQPLLWAASAGSADGILSLVNAGASVQAEDKDGLTALHCAASRGHTDCLETLIALCGAEVDVIDNNGCTAVFYAVTLGHADCTELLLNFGAEPNRQDRKGRTPAHCGASKGQLETIKLFAKHGGNLWLKNVRGDLPLHEAVISRRKDLVLWLLSQRPDTVNASNNDGRCPIHLAALNNNVEMVKILIDYRADINPLMRTGKGIVMTPLDAAIHKGNSAVAKFLQLHGGLPANSLNDAALHRRINRTLESQARSVSSLRGSGLGHDIFSPDQDLQHHFTSPEIVDTSLVNQYADSVVASILKQTSASIITSTPIMDDGVQTDSSQFLRDMQVQVSNGFDVETTTTEDSKRTIGSDTQCSTSSKKSDKKTRKKRKSVSRDKSPTYGNESTDSEENQEEMTGLSHRSSRKSRSLKTKSAVILEDSKINDQQRSLSLTNIDAQIDKLDMSKVDVQTPVIKNSFDTSLEAGIQQTQDSDTGNNDSEKFSELENVRIQSSESEFREEELDGVEIDSIALGATTESEKIFQLEPIPIQNEKLDDEKSQTNEIEELVTSMLSSDKSSGSLVEVDSNASNAATVQFEKASEPQSIPVQGDIMVEKTQLANENEDFTTSMVPFAPGSVSVVKDSSMSLNSAKSEGKGELEFTPLHEEKSIVDNQLTNENEGLTTSLAANGIESRGVGEADSIESIVATTKGNDDLESRPISKNKLDVEAQPANGNEELSTPMDACGKDNEKENEEVLAILPEKTEKDLTTTTSSSYTTTETSSSRSVSSISKESPPPSLEIEKTEDKVSIIENDSKMFQKVYESASASATSKEFRDQETETRSEDTDETIRYDYEEGEGISLQEAFARRRRSKSKRSQSPRLKTKTEKIYNVSGKVGSESSIKQNKILKTKSLSSIDQVDTGKKSERLSVREQFKYNRELLGKGNELTSIKSSKSQRTKIGERENSEEREILLQEELLNVGGRTHTGSSSMTRRKQSRIPKSNTISTLEIEKRKYLLGSSNTLDLGYARVRNVSEGKTSTQSEDTPHSWKRDSGYSDQLHPTTSASEDQNQFNLMPKSTGVLRRKIVTRRPSSGSIVAVKRNGVVMTSAAMKKLPDSRIPGKERKRFDGSGMEVQQRPRLPPLENESAGSTSHPESITSDEGGKNKDFKWRGNRPRSKLTFTKGENLNASMSPYQKKSMDVETPISVTQAMQASMRKYQLERKIFQELLELKRLQIRAGKANEQILVKRLADGYRKAGLSINYREYDGAYTFRNFEKYLYDQLRLLQANRKLLPRFAPSDDLEKLSLALKKMNATKLPFLDDDERSESRCPDEGQCTHLTHRCHHAMHAYVGIPCAAYISKGRKTPFLPKVDPSKAPGPTNLSRTPITPLNMKPGVQMIISPRDNAAASPITVEVQQGSNSQVFSLPNNNFDPTKNYYVSLSIKPSPSPPLPPMTTEDSKTKVQEETCRSSLSNNVHLLRDDSGSLSAPLPPAEAEENQI